MLTAAADVVEPDRGWGGLIAIGIAVGVFCVIAYARHVIAGPSPTPPEEDPDGVNDEVEVVSDTVDTGRGSDWWGWIVERGGELYREYVPSAARADDDQEEDEDEPETIEEYITRRLDEGAIGRGGQGYRDFVREVMRECDVSERTATRRIAEARKAR